MFLDANHHCLGETILTHALTCSVLLMERIPDAAYATVRKLGEGGFNLKLLSKIINSLF